MFVSSSAGFNRREFVIFELIGGMPHSLLFSKLSPMLLEFEFAIYQ